jgi:GGDEF domain-containing protein
MTVARWARPAGGFTARLAASVLLATAVVAAFQVVFAGRYVTRAAMDDAADRVRADAVVLQRQPADDLAATLSVIGQYPDVREVSLVDPGAVGTGTGTTDVLVRRVLASGDAEATVSPGGGIVTAAAPLTVQGRTQVLAMTMDSEPAAARATQRWHGLLLLLGGGAGAVTLLTLVIGGRSLALRYRAAVVAAFSDDLTGLGNRRAFRRRLPAAVRRAEAGPLTLALIDVVGVGPVNRDGGRGHGDALLIAVARAMPGGVDDGHHGPGHPLRRWAARLAGRPAELAAGAPADGAATGPAVDVTRAESFRLGGTGFAVTLPGATRRQAEAFVNELRERVEREAAPLGVVAGLCTLDDRCPDAETLYIGADAALHEAHRRRVAADKAGPGTAGQGTAGRARDSVRALSDKGPRQDSGRDGARETGRDGVHRVSLWRAPGPQNPMTTPDTVAEDPWDIRWLTGWD